MKAASVVVICLLLGVALADPNRRYFDEFKLKFNKQYADSVESEKRFTIFKDNLNIVEQLNSRDPHATYGITKFMDMTPEEFKSIVLMNVTLEFPQAPVAEQTHATALPTAFDWRDKSGVVTAVKDQGQCGSCWDFSATETLESVWALAGHPLAVLSEQQVVDCDQVDQGCNGGWPYDAYKYIIKAGGQESEKAYPYTARDGTCRFNKNEVVAKAASWKYVTQSRDEDAMQTFLHEHSPLSVCVDAETWQFYTGGVITTSSGCGTSIDHCVQVTGWSQQSGKTAWNVRNSWGPDWGVKGFIYVEKGHDVCAIAQVVTVPVV